MREQLIQLGLSIVQAIDVLRRVKMRRSKPLRQGDRFLFLMYSPALGTSLNGTPIFEALKTLIPHCQIAVAAAGIPFDIVRDNPFVDLAFRTPRPETTFIGTLWALRRSLDKSGFNPQWVCTDSWNQRTKTVMLGVLAGAFTRIGYATHQRLLDVALTYDPGMSIIDNNLMLLKALGVPSPHFEPRIFFPEDTLGRCQQMLPEGSRARAVLIVRGSGTQPTDWYDDRFAEAGDFLASELNAEIIFVGIAQDNQRIEEIRRLMKEPSINLAGKTNISELAAVLASCDVGICIDTGAMHAARAVELPFVLLASAHEPPHKWLPLNQSKCSIIQKLEIGCRFCHRKRCDTRECMEGIGTSEVKAAVRLLMKRYPVSAEAREARIKRSLSFRAVSDMQTAAL